MSKVLGPQPIPRLESHLRCHWAIEAFSLHYCACPGVEIDDWNVTARALRIPATCADRSASGKLYHQDVTIDELLQLDHRREIPTQSANRADEVFTHLLWSDPRDEDGWKPSSRGAGVEFGPDITKAFCARNKISLIIRSHECREEGFDIAHDGLLLTIFSASSYCGSQTNKGAYVQLTLGDEGEVKPNVVQFSSQPLQKLKDAGRNEWRKKAQRLERRTLMSLVEIICEKKNALLTAFMELDTTGTGRVTKLEWKATLQKVLGIQARFLSYFRQLAEVDQQGCVEYQKFLNRYTVQLDGGNVEWRRNLIRKVWKGFMQALPCSSEADVEKMTLQDKLYCAFNLFQSSSPGAHKKEVALKAAKLVRSNSISSSQSDRQKESYRLNGVVTYEMFRNTIQEKLQLRDTLSEQQIFELMQHLDQNHDGVVDYHEFCSFFAEFSRTDYLQEIFEVNDTKAISLLNRCATLLQQPNKFASLRDAFDAFDHSKTGKLTLEDIMKGTRELGMVPELDTEETQLLFNAILLSYYGINQRHQWDKRGLDWIVFEDTFSPDSTFQQRLWMASLGASNTNLAALDVRESLSWDEDTVQDSRVSKDQAWADTFVDSVKQSLHEQRLYIKFLFRILDRKRHGYVTKEQFIVTMQAINEEHGAPLKLSQLEHLADAFACRTTLRRMSMDGDEKEETRTYVSYPEFLRSLRIIDSGPTEEKEVACKTQDGKDMK